MQYYSKLLYKKYIMFVTGVFYAWDFLAIIACTLCYIYLPNRLLPFKMEWVKFLLFFGSGYFTFFWILRNELQDDILTHAFFMYMFFPSLLLSYIVYPSRQTKKNPHVVFFLLFISLYVLLLNGSVLIGWLFSNM